jgi:succinyl-CoA synthetase beta subunit
LIEYEGKQIFARYGIRVPRSLLLSKDEYDEPPEPDFDYPIVIKGQYPHGGRGKSGAILIAKDHDEYVHGVHSVRDVIVGGRKPEYILVEEFIEHDKEYYLSIVLSRREKRPVILASPHGGIDIEELAQKPGAIMSLPVDPLIGYSDYLGKVISKFLLDKIDMNLLSMIGKLYSLFIENDLLLVEVNPLVIADSPIALDSKIMVDDNASYRHDYTGYVEYSKLVSEGERIAGKYGFSFVPLDGNIGVIGNGAGLVMATVDLVKYYGGKPACFLDVGGGASAERMSKAIEVVIDELDIDGLFINIFAGITRCDEVARGIIKVKERLDEKKIKVAVRLVGTNEDLGASLLENAGIKVYKDMDSAAIEVIRG